MPRIHMTIAQFQRFLPTLTPKIERALVRGLRSGGRWLERTVVEEIRSARPYPAVDTGVLRNSVTYRPEPKGASVSVDAPYAPMIEHGTRPFYPPLEPLVRWVQRKGFVPRTMGRGPGKYLRAVNAAIRIARAVQRKIAREGIAPRHFFSKAYVRAVPMIEAEVAWELSRLDIGRVHQWGGRGRAAVAPVLPERRGGGQSGGDVGGG